ncbi:MAG TPA: glycosyltransferase family 2 protein [Pyrinomonadaceae bacterium]|nr:glycosyltransferase family 2 protein [Pyrinomonadaceae bacterium]
MTQIPPDQRQTAAYPLSLSVVVPVYNEEGTLGEVVSKVLKVPHVLEVIIVDDCSTDSTPDVARELSELYSQVRSVRQPKSGGKTAALKTGFALTRGDIVIVQDADLEYDPDEIFLVIQPILEGHADVVFGSRFLIRKAARVLYFYHFLANKALTFISNTLTNLNMTDIETGYKAFRGDIIRNMIIVSNGFGFEVEVTAKVAKLKCPIYEVPISYYGRTYSEGKKIRFRDGLAAFWLVFRFNIFCSLRSSFHRLPELQPKPGHQTTRRFETESALRE